jgi:hypothetical protein
LATRLVEAASESLTAETGQDRFATVLDALAYSPVRAQVTPKSIPAEPNEALLAAVRKVASRLPEIAKAFGIEAAAPKSKGRAPRPPKPPVAPTNASAQTGADGADDAAVPAPAEPSAETPAETPATEVVDDGADATAEVPSTEPAVEPTAVADDSTSDDASAD